MKMNEELQQEEMGQIAAKIKQFFSADKEKGNEKAPLIGKENRSTSETFFQSHGRNPLAVSDGEECHDQVADCLCQIEVLECKLTEQQQLVEEHENKIRMLEDIIRRQLLVLKETDPTFTKQDSVEKTDELALTKQGSTQSLHSNDSVGVLDFLEDVVESVETAFSDNSIGVVALHVRKHGGELEKHEDLLNRHNSILEDHIKKLEQVNQLLEKHQQLSRFEKRVKQQTSEVENCRKKLDEHDSHIAKSIKRQDKRLDDAWSAIWINILTVILAVFFSKISALWS